MGVKQGQLSAMHALAALASHSHQSFFYSPSLELFKTGSPEPRHEIDVLAVAEGEFVIGEVKGGGITYGDFVELAEIAEVAATTTRNHFSASREYFLSDVMKWMRTKYKTVWPPKGIKAQIFALPTF